VKAKVACGAPALAVDVDVDEMPAGGRQRIVVAEQPDLVPDAARPELRHPDAGVDDVREGDRAEVIALCLDDEADDRARPDVERALLDEVLVHHRVEVRVVDDVVHVAVDVVVHPAHHAG
jgi:hypothetical protein